MILLAEAKEMGGGGSQFSYDPEQLLKCVMSSNMEEEEPQT